MNRVDILNEAYRLTGQDRQEIYGDPMPNHAASAALITTFLQVRGLMPHDRQVLPSDVARIMVLVKTARDLFGGRNIDNSIDAAAYAAIAGELSEMEAELATEAKDD